MSATLPQARAVPRFEPQLARRKLAGTIFLGACMAAIGLLMLALVLLLYEVLSKGLPYLDGEFLTSFPSRRPAAAGVLPALIGSIEIGLMVGAVSFPIGIGAAVYLAEYAPDNRITRLLQTNISNLAGVPSIIYGIFGLALFVRALGLGRSPLAAALTLALLIIPIVINATVEALKAEPDSQREAANALG